MKLTGALDTSLVDLPPKDRRVQSTEPIPKAIGEQKAKHDILSPLWPAAPRRRKWTVP